jgi:hypothetical protein
MRTKAQDEVKKQPFLRHAQQCNTPLLPNFCGPTAHHPFFFTPPTIEQRIHARLSAPKALSFLPVLATHTTHTTPDSQGTLPLAPTAWTSKQGAWSWPSRWRARHHPNRPLAQLLQATATTPLRSLLFPRTQSTRKDHLAEAHRHGKAARTQGNDNACCRGSHV